MPAATPDCFQLIYGAGLSLWNGRISYMALPGPCSPCGPFWSPRVPEPCALIPSNMWRSDTAKYLLQMCIRSYSRVWYLLRDREPVPDQTLGSSPLLCVGPCVQLLLTCGACIWPRDARLLCRYIVSRSITGCGGHGFILDLLVAQPTKAMARFSVKTQ